MKLPKLALAIGIAVITSFPLAAQKWAQLEGGKGYTSGAETILAKVTPQPASRVVETARSFEGLPYVWAGASPTKGFDCSGFVHEVMRLNGYSVPRMADHQFYKSSRVAKADLKPGDMVFFETYLPGPSHVGFYIGADEFIHASSSGRGVTVSNLKTRYYADRFLGGGRPADWQDGSERAAMSAPSPQPRQQVASSQTPVKRRVSSSPAVSRSKPVVASRPFANPPRPTLVALPSTTGSAQSKAVSVAQTLGTPAPEPTAIPR